MFVDKESLFLKSGDGGDGMTSFLRYKGVSNGGPDGGDGGKGGSIYFVGDRHKSSLIDFMYKRKFVAENGGKGEPNNCHGKNGEDVYIGVPLGTVVKDRETGSIWFWRAATAARATCISARADVALRTSLRRAKKPR